MTNETGSAPEHGAAPRLAAAADAPHPVAEPGAPPSAATKDASHLVATPDTPHIVATIKWGRAYPAGEFNRLARAVADRAPGVGVACVTDDPLGLDPAIRVCALPEIPLDRVLWNTGMWPKMALFAPAVLPAGARILFLDCDVAVTGDLAPLFAEIRPGHLSIARDWKTPEERVLPWLFGKVRGGNSSALGFVAGDQAHLWEVFAADAPGSLGRYRNDQDMITRLAEGMRYFPAPLVASFKKSCEVIPGARYVTACRPPAGAAVVAFHGQPKLDAVTGSVAWARAYAAAYD